MKLLKIKAETEKDPVEMEIEKEFKKSKIL